LIIKREDAEKLLGITFSTDQAALVDMLIPYLQSMVIKYCNNSFLNHNIYLTASTISFSDDTITDSNAGFVDAYFVAGDYKIRGSKLNDGHVEVSEVAAGALTVNTASLKDNSLITEAADNIITITKVDFPEDIKPVFARLINYYLNQKSAGVKSESLPGGYSVVYQNEREAMNAFNQWAKPFQ